MTYLEICQRFKKEELPSDRSLDWGEGWAEALSLCLFYADFSNPLLRFQQGHALFARGVDLEKPFERGYRQLWLELEQALRREGLL